MYELSGVVRPAIEAYYASVLDPRAPAMTIAQIEVMRAYLQRWIELSLWAGPGISELRESITGLTTRDSIARWLDRALDAGIDPL